MSYCLIGLENDSKFNTNNDGWMLLLDLADKYGWVAEGTDPSIYYCSASEREAIRVNDPNYDAGYYGSEGQIVISTDANKIADALEKALNDISDDDDENIKYQTLKLPAQAGQEPATIEVEGDDSVLKRQRNPLKYFSGLNNKSWIKDFVKFCRHGAFTIE